MVEMTIVRGAWSNSKVFALLFERLRPQMTKSVAHSSSIDDLRVFTLSEVAERLHVSPRTVQRMIDSGDLKTLRPRYRGRVIHISAASLRNYINGDGSTGARVCS